ANPGHELCTYCSCAHSRSIICNLKGRAFWWMMARLAGWDDTTECVNHGDVNLNGQLTASDAQLAFLITLGLYEPTFEEECAADCNGDLSVTAADAQDIFYAVIGIGSCVDEIQK
ncbi:dockerin type I repeat-containing protein, partial [bacterium]|nr:dockerin type I repeat-containing protein [bacterium]